MKKVLTLLIIGIPFISIAQVQHAPFSASVFVEEDQFNHHFNQDRNYTGGGAITLTGSFTESNWFAVPFFRRNLDRLCHIDGLFNRLQGKSYYAEANAVSLGTSVFTPENLKRISPVRGDRPYASLTFFSSKKIRVWGNPCNGYMRDRMAVTTELNTGVLGTVIGDSLQTWIHRNAIKNNPGPWNRPIPRGWNNQISNGGEFTAMYRLTVQNNLGDLYWSKAANIKVIQLSSLAEVQLGYYTNVCAGLNLRVGFFRAAFWQNNANFGNSTNELTFAAVPADTTIVADNEGIDHAGIYENTGISNARRPNRFPQVLRAISRNFEIYSFADGRSRLVGYNALLEGQFNYSRYTLDARHINHMVHEFEAGFAVRVWKFVFMYEPIAGRTSELKTHYARTHIWGAAYLSFTPFLN